MIWTIFGACCAVLGFVFSTICISLLYVGSRVRLTKAKERGVIAKDDWQVFSTAIITALLTVGGIWVFGPYRVFWMYGVIATIIIGAICVLVYIGSEIQEDEHLIHH